MSIDQFFLLLVFASVLLGSPGPATISLAASGAAYGWVRSIPFLGGIIAGFSFNLLASAFGLAALFIQYPTSQELFKYISSIYIIYLAWKIFKSETIEISDAQPLRFSHGFILNILNPKAYIAAIASITQFTSTGGNQLLEISIIVITCLITAVILQFGWIVAGEFLGRIFSSNSSAKKLNTIMAIIMVVSVLYTVIYVT